MSGVVADKYWYKEISESKGLSTHCPYATVVMCPRFYQSLSLLSNTGATKIEEKEDEKLLKKWKKSDLWPRIDEQATSVCSSEGKFHNASNYCPEVLYIRFGVFAKSIGSFSDELDQATKYSYLKSTNAPPNDVRWCWDHVEPLHYADCPLYPILVVKTPMPQNIPWWREHLLKIVVGIVIAFVGAIIKISI